MPFTRHTEETDFRGWSRGRLAHYTIEQYLRRRPAPGNSRALATTLGVGSGLQTSPRRRTDRALSNAATWDRQHPAGKMRFLGVGNFTVAPAGANAPTVGSRTAAGGLSARGRQEPTITPSAGMARWACHAKKSAQASGCQVERTTTGWLHWLRSAAASPPAPLPSPLRPQAFRPTAAGLAERRANKRPIKPKYHVPADHLGDHGTGLSILQKRTFLLCVDKEAQVGGRSRMRQPA